MSRERCIELDRADPLAPVRGRFVLPDDLVYLDGNSLGALPAATVGRLRAVVEEEWGRGLIRSWNAAGWIDSPVRVGDRIGRLVGAAPGQVVATDSTSVNLFKVLAAALSARPGRRTLLTEADNFPTDVYIAEGLATLTGARLRVVPPGTAAGAVDDDVAALFLTHVHYTSGRITDMQGLTAAAHDAGALAVWDLSHSAGAVPVDLDEAGADMAVGCGYKYLSGGPGAPAYVYVARALQEASRQPLSGWMGHARPFAFDLRYEPGPGMLRWLSGTPSILGLAALDSALDIWLDVDLGEARAKAEQLTDLFIALVDSRCWDLGLTLLSPRRADERGAQVALRHPQGHAVMQALIDRGIVGDFRAPDLVRFGFSPLTTRFADAWDAAEALRDILATGAHRDPRFTAVQAVT